MPPEARLTKTQRLADRYLTQENWSKTERLREFAVARGRSPLELAFSWLLAQHPVTSVIAGATKPEQVAQNVEAGNWVLSATDLAEIDRLSSAG